MDVWVDSASDGGDGTTEALQGVHAAFKEPAHALNSLTSWPGTLASAVNIICKASTGLAYVVPCPNSVMDQVTATDKRLTITVKEGHRHPGYPDLTKVRMEIEDNSAFYNNYGSHVTIEWFQVAIKVTTSTGANYNCYRLCTANNQSANIDHRISHCLGWRDPASTGTDHVIGTINSKPDDGGNTGNCRVSWCGFWDCYAGVNSDGGDPDTGWAANKYFIDNVTCVDNQINFLDIMRCRNCLGTGNTFAGDFLSVGTKGSSNNLSGDASAPGPNSLINREGQVLYVNAAAKNFHLQQTDVIAATGGLTNPAAEAAPTDIDNEPLTVPWPIGFDQFHEHVAPLPPPGPDDLDDDWWPIERHG